MVDKECSGCLRTITICMITGKLFLFWIPMIAIAFLNAMLRQLVFLHFMGESRAQQLSTITLIIFCSIYVWIVFPLLPIQDGRHALLLGAWWMLLTIGFEFLLGMITKKTWREMIANYDLASGNLWPLFLLFLLVLPYCCYWFRK